MSWVKNVCFKIAEICVVNALRGGTHTRRRVLLLDVVGSTENRFARNSGKNSGFGDLY